MKLFTQCLSVDLRRSVLSGRFLAATIGFSILLCANLPLEPWPQEATYLFSISYKYGFYIFFFLCAAIPYARSYLADIDADYILNIVRRTSLLTYSLSKCIAVMVSGGLSVIVATGIFLAYLFIRFPAVSDVTISYSGWDVLISQYSALHYIAVKTLLTAVTGGNFAVVALVISTVIKNSFVVLAMPVLIYYLINELVMLFEIPMWCNMIGFLYYPVFPGHYLASLLYFIALNMIVFLVAASLFYMQMRRLRCHGYCP